ncbi:integration host factor, actinobacterial type [Rothia sp. ZJ932]|uniref:integration host factor, actinobacterial type n=1 Tax=Rothia sp. ZJ932 TaxID=2810516 RepID=UPI0019678744|nr:integration host factor, actinobacterial type [Rothia sp. ZJ932]QRZ60701.1 DNA-binding protein [Rothia sp. ZJ932]
MIIKPLTNEQRAEARAKANISRAARAAVKEDLKQRKITVEEVLERSKSDEALSRLKVVDLLRSIPSIGEIKAEAIMAELNIASSRRLRGLGIHQRQALIDYLNR